MEAAKRDINFLTNTDLGPFGERISGLVHQSSFGMNSSMAKITVVIITLALAIDFLLLPAILINLARDGRPEVAEAPVEAKLIVE